MKENEDLVGIIGSCPSQTKSPSLAPTQEAGPLLESSLLPGKHRQGDCHSHRGWVDGQRPTTAPAGETTASVPAGKLVSTPQRGLY